jgi:phage terminase large subunit
MTLPANYSARRAFQSHEWLLKAKLEQAKRHTAIRQARERCRWDYEFRGNMGAAFDEAIREHQEVLLCGAAGTGKTLRILHWVNEVCWAYSGARVLIVRKVRADLAQSTLVTFERDVMGTDNPIVSNIQRPNRMSYRYPNGSEIVVGGLDRPGSVLSAEYDVIYVAEATQLTLMDWEMLIMRLRAGPYPHPLLVADTNPDRPDHWLKQRADANMTKMLNTYHKDNPAWWDGEKWTAKGEAYIFGKLHRMSGVRRKRYLDNQWAIAEGAIYDEWDESVHLIDEDKLPQFVRRWRSIDFGYRNPFVVQWWGEDYDNRLYLYREIYQTELLVSDAALEIVRLEAGLSGEDLTELKRQYADHADPYGRFWLELWRMARQLEPIEATIADHDAEDRATLEKYGIATIAARKGVGNGIQAVQSRIRVQADGKPRIYIVRGARIAQDGRLKDAGKPTSTAEEMPGYVWNDATRKEEPVKVDDHGVDALRYMVMSLDDPGMVSSGVEIRQSNINWRRNKGGRRR